MHAVAYVKEPSLKAAVFASPDLAELCLKNEGTGYLLTSPDQIQNLSDDDILKLFNILAPTPLNRMDRLSSRDDGVKKLLKLIDVTPPRAEYAGPELPISLPRTAPTKPVKRVLNLERGINLPPTKKAYPCRAGSKQAKLIDLLSRENGATLSELVAAMNTPGTKPWTETSVKTGLNWDVHTVKGYGIRTEFTGSLQALRDAGHSADADRLEKLEPEMRKLTAIYYLVTPIGQTIPAHEVPKKAKSAGDAK